MTTFQDPQPQSRRAVRQSERDDNDRAPVEEPQVGFTQFSSTALPAAPQFLNPVAPPATGRRSSANPLQEPRDATPPPTQAMPQVEQPAFRVRDFRPEGRRAAAAAPEAVPPVAPAAVSAPPVSAPLVSAPPAPAPPAFTSAAPVSQAPVWTTAPVAAAAPIFEVPTQRAPATPEFAIEQTLTRRELRALQREEEGSLDDDGPHGPAVALALALAPAPLAPPLAPATPAAPAAEASPISDGPQPWPFGGLVSAPNSAEAVVEPETPFSRLIEEEPASVWTAPIGHWSTQAGLDDDAQPYESTINRTVGSGTVTTNALVLGAVPGGGDIRGPLTATGEIMLTGSIDLPREFTATGATARVEHHGIDALFDLHDAEVVTTDSQPVRAISAVSTHNSGQGVTHTQKPKGTRALTALVISAAVMAVVVVGLLVAVFALNLF